MTRYASYSVIIRLYNHVKYEARLIPARLLQTAQVLTCELHELYLSTRSCTMEILLVLVILPLLLSKLPSSAKLKLRHDHLGFGSDKCSHNPSANHLHSMVNLAMMGLCLASTLAESNFATNHWPV